MRPETIELRQIRMSLRRPFRTSFGETRERHVVLVEVRQSGLSGFGEVTAAEGPFFSHESYETAWHVLSDYVIPWMLGKELGTPADLLPLVAPIRGHRMAIAGLETALWDLFARQQRRPLWEVLGGRGDPIACGVSIGIQDSAAALVGKVGEALEAGYRRVKVKIRPGHDEEPLGELRRMFPEIALAADANAAYTLADLEHLKRLDEFGLLMLEQPLHWEDILDHAELQRAIRTPICLDESIHSADDVRKAIGAGACRIVNVKLGRVGGHAAAREAHDRAEAAGAPVWCGGMLETGIGRAHNVALSSLPNFRLPGDVSASRRYWVEDIVDPEIEVSGEGTIRQSNAPGIGHRVRLDRIDALTERRRSFSA
jgi:O-succinylbenzoate synthase